MLRIPRDFRILQVYYNRTPKLLRNQLLRLINIEN